LKGKIIGEKIMNKLLLPLPLLLMIIPSPLQTTARANEITRQVCEKIDGQYAPATGMCIDQEFPLISKHISHGVMFIYPQEDDH
jgi:hypothetical protein